MPTNVKWLVENIVLHIEISGEAEIDVVMQAMGQAAKLIDESDAVLVHSLVDARQAIQTNLSVRDRVSSIQPLLSHDRCGWVLLVRDSHPIANFVSSTAAQVLRARFRHFNEIKDALEFLEKMAPNLPEDFAVADYI